MRLGSMYPWTALDISRGLIIALPLMLAWLWAYRMTHNRIASVLTSIMLMFAGGARWLLLLLPQPILQLISNQITLIGSASVTAPNLLRAMLSNWKITAAPHSISVCVSQRYLSIIRDEWLYQNLRHGLHHCFALLLTAQRWRNLFASVITLILISSLALANEVAFGLIGLGFVFAMIVWMISHRSWKLPSGMLRWIAVLVPVGLAVVIQGGMFTEIVRARFTSGPGSGGSYFDATPNFVWPPAVISAHFGALSLFNLSQLIVALTEIGPIILALPLVIIWGWKTLLAQNWYEAALIGTFAWSVPSLFVAFKGPLYTATPRLLDGLFCLHALLSSIVLDMGTQKERCLAQRVGCWWLDHNLCGLDVIRHSADFDSKAGDHHVYQ